MSQKDKKFFNITPVQFKIDIEESSNKEGGLNGEGKKQEVRGESRSKRLKRVSKSPWSDYNKSIKLDRFKRLEQAFKRNERKIFNMYFDKKESVKVIDDVGFIDTDVIYKQKLDITGLLGLNENNIFSCSFDSKIYHYNSVAQSIKIFSGHFKGVTDIWLSFPLLFSVSFDQKMKVWDLKREKCIFRKKFDIVPLKIYLDKTIINKELTTKLDAKVNAGIEFLNKQGLKRRKFVPDSTRQLKKEGKIDIFENISSIVIGTSSAVVIFDNKFSKVKEIKLGSVLRIQADDKYYFIHTTDRALHLVDKNKLEICKKFEEVNCFSLENKKIYLGKSQSITVYDSNLQSSHEIASKNNYFIKSIDSNKLLSVKLDGNVDFIEDGRVNKPIVTTDSTATIIFSDGKNIFVGMENGSVKKYELE